MDKSDLSTWWIIKFPKILAGGGYERQEISPSNYQVDDWNELYKNIHSEEHNSWFFFIARTEKWLVRLIFIPRSPTIESFSKVTELKRTPVTETWQTPGYVSKHLVLQTTNSKLDIWVTWSCSPALFRRTKQNLLAGRMKFTASLLHDQCLTSCYLFQVNYIPGNHKNR